MDARRLWIPQSLLLLVIASSLAAAPTPSAPAAKLSPPAAQEPFDAFVDNLVADWLRADPMSATSSQYFSGAEQDALDRKLNAKDPGGTPLDAKERQARTERALAALVRLKAYSTSELSPVQRVSRAMLVWKLDDILRQTEFADHRFVFDQFRGLQVGLVNFLSQTHPVRNARDIENYLVRLAQVAPALDLGIAAAKVRAAAGVVPPKFILKSTLDGIDRFLGAEPAKNVLVAALDERAAKVDKLSAESRAASVAAATKIVGAEIIPAFGRVRTLLTDQMKTATDDAGLWSQPHGAEAYAAALASNTTTDLTPDQIHELGLKEVARIEGEMNVLLRQIGYTEGTVKARYEKLDADSQPPAEPDPRSALLARYEDILRDAEKRAALAFDVRPKAPVVVKREPPFTEKGAAAHYTAPAPDGTRPGIFWAPLPGPEYKVNSMRTLVYHEGVPGHHFQITLQQELPEIPRFRQRGALGGISAFSEGWALYTEQLAAELGWYDGDGVPDVRGHLGQLSAELFRARRLVVDTGLHAKHWTRQQAIDYGIPPEEVERYVVMPGQACSYKIGMLKILELRAKAERELGARFSLKEFHNVVLRTGSVPLDVLAGVVDEWIAKSKTAA
ncbi:MAG: DUF885 domain-containing protein [Acidobacteriota bacterium]